MLRMPPLLLIALAVVAVLFILRTRQGGSGGKTSTGGLGHLFAGRSKCSGCRHAKKIFDDGTLCTFGRRETFKNSVHVSNCIDRAPR